MRPPRPHLSQPRRPQGGNVTLREETAGSGCANFFGNPASCLVAGIPSSKLEGTYDIAVFDINGDDWPDLVIGRCTGTEVWINQPYPAAGAVPDGDATGGEMLRLRKLGSQIRMTWGESCNQDDSDFVVVRGELAAPFTQHAPLACSTGGLRSHTFFPQPGDAYFLVVPRNDEAEGSYGRSSSGLPRGQGLGGCLPQSAGSCQ